MSQVFSARQASPINCTRLASIAKHRSNHFEDRGRCINHNNVKFIKSSFVVFASVTLQNMVNELRDDFCNALKNPRHAFILTLVTLAVSIQRLAVTVSTTTFLSQEYFLLVNIHE